MSTSNFEYGTVAIGVYKGMLWLTILVTFSGTFLLTVYILLMLFLGLGLKPFLINTGLASQYQAFTAKRSDIKNEQLRQGNYKRNGQKMDDRDKHLEIMRKKMMPKE